MRRVAVRSLSVMLVLVLVVGSSFARERLNIFNWSEYMPDSILRDFEAEYDVDVVYDTYGSNEEMLAKLMAGGLGQYDLVVPSDYMVAVMIEEGLAEEIDLTQIPNLTHIDPKYLDTPYDPGNRFSLPYMWGTTGIAYNTRLIKSPITSWNDLWDPAYNRRLLLLDDSREVIGMALQSLGYSINETDSARLKEAQRRLSELAPRVVAYDNGFGKDLLVSEEVWIAHTWNGDAAMAMEENSDITYVLPKEGGVTWQDNVVIPKGAPNVRSAHLFINYLYRPEVSAVLAAEFPYGSPNKDARTLLPDEVRNNPAAYPDPEAIAKAEWIEDVGDATVTYDRIYTEIRRY